MDFAFCEATGPALRPAQFCTIASANADRRPPPVTPNRRDWSLDCGGLRRQRNNRCHAAGVIITCASSPRRHAQGHPQEHVPQRQEVDVVIQSGLRL